MDKRERYFVDDDVPNQVEEDFEDFEEQEGGWKGRGSRKYGYTMPNYVGFGDEMSARKPRTKGFKAPPVRGGDKPPVKRSPNQYRTYRAIVDGEELVGTHGDQKLIDTDAPAPRRYFHGSPEAAARKVISSIHKRHEHDVIGIGKAVHVHLIEVTKGYRNSKGKHFEYDYFGWREPYTGTMSRGGKQIEVTGKNRAVPTRGKKTAEEALRISENIGKRVQAGKNK